MRRILLTIGACLALASPARAAGQIHLAVGDCGGPSTITNNPCTNTGNIILVMSIVSPVASSQVVGFEGVVNIAQAGVLSDWWRLDGLGCRAGKLHSDADFTSTLTACYDLYAGHGTEGQSVIYPASGSTLIPLNSERLDVYAAVDAATPLTVDASTEYSLFHIVILVAGTVGGCTGCETPTSLYADDMLMGQEPGLGSVHFYGDGVGQGISYNGGNTPTPTRQSSWGAIKSLYR